MSHTVVRFSEYKSPFLMMQYRKTFCADPTLDTFSSNRKDDSAVSV